MPSSEPSPAPGSNGDDGAGSTDANGSSHSSSAGSGSARTAAVDLGLLSPGTVAAGALVSDAAVAEALVEVEVALLRVLAAHELAPSGAAEALAAAVEREPLSLDALAAAAVDGGNPVIPLLGMLRSRLAETDAASAAAVHRGATSQDILDTALMLVATRAGRRTLGHLEAAAGHLAHLAERHRDTPAIARTLTQHSVPTSFGLVAAGWLAAVDEARDALARALSALPVQLGGASGTLASFAGLTTPAVAAALPGELAAELGLATPLLPWHTRRTPVTRLGDALAELGDALGVIAGDVATLSRSEIAELSEGGAPGRGGSSAMPQKRNPVLSVLIRSHALRGPSLAADLHRASALSVDQRPDGAWHSEWPVLRELLRIALGSAELGERLLGGLEVDEARMLATLQSAGPAVLTERLSLELPGLVGVERTRELVAAIVAGEDAHALLSAEPAVGGRAGELLDPLLYTGIAGALVDATLAAHGARAAETSHDGRGASA